MGALGGVVYLGCMFLSSILLLKWLESVLLTPYALSGMMFGNVFVPKHYLGPTVGPSKDPLKLIADATCFDYRKRPSVKKLLQEACFEGLRCANALVVSK